MEDLMIGTPITRISLIARLSDISDHEAWREFAALYEPFIYRQGRRFGLQPADARELVQEVLIAVSKAVRNFEVAPDRGRFRTWLYAVGRNVCLRYLAKLRSQELSGQNSALTAMLAEIPNREPADTGELNVELQRHFFLAMSRQARKEFQPNTWAAFWQTAVENHSIPRSLSGHAVCRWLFASRVGHAIRANRYYFGAANGSTIGSSARGCPRTRSSASRCEAS
jgi:RNA polymerase sigma factor (sigma-70 family)